MIKYVETLVGFSEVPDEITLCINISNCPIHCSGCHSKHLWDDVGEELNEESLKQLIEKNSGITCISFMGGDSEPEEINKLAKWVKDNTNLKVCWYSGRQLNGLVIMSFSYFDFIKTGPYESFKGGLDSKTTNQRFYKIEYKKDEGYPYYTLEDITYKFWK